MGAVSTDGGVSSAPGGAIALADDSAIAVLREMLEIESSSGQEAALAAHVEGVAASLGMSARRDAVGNVVVETGAGDGPTILLMGHLDTACGPLPVRLRDGRLYGRGAVDAKGPLATMLCAAASRRAFRGRIVVAGVVEEETPGSLGANHLARTLSRPDALVVGEPSGWSDVVLGYKGQLALTYVVRRPSTHPTNPMEKATEAAAAFWSDVAGLLGGAAGASFHELTATLLRFEGDMVEATLAIDCRLPPAFAVDAFLDELRAKARGGELRVESQIPAVKTDRRDPMVRALTAAIRAHGGTPGHKVKTATSDMNTVAPHWSVPMATYGPGDSALDHHDDEHVEIADYLRAIAVVTDAIDDVARDLPFGVEKTGARSLV